MKEPNLVGDCVSAMKNSCELPITIKTRIGYDDIEDYQYLKKFLTIIKKAGAETFVVHARRAILSKLSPKQNLNIPPLNYNFVYDLKKDFKDNTIILNGGIDNIDKVKTVAIKNNKTYHQQYCEVLIENKLSNQEKYFGRTKYMIPVIFDSDSCRPGELVNVKITSFNQN